MLVYGWARRQRRHQAHDRVSRPGCDRTRQGLDSRPSAFRGNAGSGATATSSFVAGNVRSQAMAIVAPTAEMRRITDWQLRGRNQIGRFRAAKRQERTFRLAWVPSQTDPNSTFNCREVNGSFAPHVGRGDQLGHFLKADIACMTLEVAVAPHAAIHASYTRFRATKRRTAGAWPPVGGFG